MSLVDDFEKHIEKLFGSRPRHASPPPKSMAGMKLAFQQQGSEITWSLKIDQAPVLTSNVFRTIEDARFNCSSVMKRLGFEVAFKFS